MICLAILLERINNFGVNRIKKLIIFFGMNSYVVLAFHQVLLMTTNKAFNDLGYPIPGYANLLLMWILLTIAIFIINKYFPFVLGKKRNKSFKVDGGIAD